LEIVQSPEQAELMYPRLFLRVFKVLAQPSTKMLNLAILRDELSLPQVGVSDQVILEFIKNILSSIDSRLNCIDDRFEALEVRTNELESIVIDPSLTDSAAAVFKYQLSTLNISKPSLISNGSKRDLKVISVLDLYEKASWINFQGINGCGKSQLASLLAEKFKEVFWLDLRPFLSDSHKCFSLVQTFLTIISGAEVSPNRKVWLGQVSGGIPDETLIV
jgi:hypothetical protein